MSKDKFGSTQKFTEIEDIVEDMVILSGKRACLIIEVQSTNFALLSVEEQNTKIYGYASLLNSLSFPIQVLVKNKKVDISVYTKSLEAEIKRTQNQKLAMQMGLYLDFVEELVKVNEVLDKKFYMVISYSTLEKGAVGTLQKGDFIEQAKQALQTKANSLHSQLARLNLKAKTLEKEEIIKLFYSIYNEGVEEGNFDQQQIETPVVQGQKNI